MLARYCTLLVLPQTVSQDGAQQSGVTLIGEGLHTNCRRTAMRTNYGFAGCDALGYGSTFHR